MIPPSLTRRGFLAGATAAGLAPLPLARLEAAPGEGVAEGMLDVFLTGTTTPAPVFADAALSRPLPNPVRTDGTGHLPAIYLDPAITYRLRARTKAGSAIAGMDFDPVPGAGANAAAFRQNDPDAVARPLAARLADTVNLLDFQDPAAGNDITRALELIAYQAFPDRQAVNVQLPAGHYRVTRQILPARQFNLRGAGMSATILDFQGVTTVNPVMQGAISFGRLDTLQAHDPAYSSKVRGSDPGNAINGADFSTIEQLTIKLGGTPGLDYAVWTAARLFCRDVMALRGGFKWCAGNLQATRGRVAGNANICLFDNCHSLLATAHGFMADGDDANACKIIGCNAYEPTGFGYYDASFLGNSYVACHASASGTCGYKAIAPGGANRSTFDGCYCEENSGLNWDVAAPAMIISPRGVMPDTKDAEKNVTLAPMHGGGWATGSPMTFVADLGTYFTFGSPRAAAARVSPGGLVVRGQGGDGDLYQFVASGQQWGGGPGLGTGASIVKRGGVSGTNYELIRLGDPRHRPAFPRGLAATLPTHADNAAALRGGLEAGDVYKDAGGTLRIVL